MDFVHDQLATGRKIRVLTVVDTFSRFSPVVDPRFSCRGEDVVKTLELACKTVGYPTAIRVDQGSAKRRSARLVVMRVSPPAGRPSLHSTYTS
jgi:transposase InsO family protein